MHYLFNQEVQQWMGISNNFTCWIVKTYLHVKQSGIPCEVVDHIPKKGIVIADRDTLGNTYPYLDRVMLICTKGDREFHPSAHLHVVQNPSDLLKRRNLVWNPYYIPLWPQPGLIPRSKERGSLVENVAFMGTRSNFAKELLSEKWIDSLDTLGCKWHPVFNPNQWIDYGSIDIIVAVRSFDRRTYTHKPANKLINCWRAGVPAIIGPESAFLAVRKSELDFILVNSIDEAIDAVKRLKKDRKLYISMVENGLKRAKEFSDNVITENWRNFFHEYVFPEYEKWQPMSEFRRRFLFVTRYIKLKLDRMQARRARVILNKF